jgi:hypothetical protein
MEGLETMVNQGRERNFTLKDRRGWTHFASAGRAHDENPEFAHLELPYLG